MKNQPNHLIREYTISNKPASGTEGEQDEIDRIRRSKRFAHVDEKEVWEEFRQGNEAAFIHIYIKYYGELINFGIQFTRDKPLIEDIIQNLFIQLREKPTSLPKLRSSIRLFLFQCLKRKFFDHQKKNKYILPGWMPGDLNVPFEIVLAEDTRMIMDQDQQEQLEKLRQSISQLNARQREVLYYYYYKNFSYEEIRLMMGFSNIASVRNLVYKAIAILKKTVVVVCWWAIGAI